MAEFSGVAKIGQDSWKIRFAIGQTVFHAANLEKNPGIVTKIGLQKGRVVYFVEWGSARYDEHPEEVLTEEFRPDYGA